jgi:hypothetical protein
MATLIRILILLGSVGLTSSIATLILSFVGRGEETAWVKIVVLLGGVLVIFLFSRSRYIHRIMKKVISSTLSRWTRIRLYDYEQVLGLSKGYTICRLKVKEDSWMKDRTLKDLQINMEGALILAIYRTVDGEEKFIGAPKGDTKIRAGDLLVCYSRRNVSEELFQREKGLKGDQSHESRKSEERKLLKERESKGGYD